ncbi:LytTR family DNA-binding domain-containing protein [Marinilabilia salmonicolor]|jgi:DNA-binding LytR/AlgR family response regulator|uniref:LytTR family two component transcriptional regulator n=1 Tax=Marinilabilia salmonicolor TaxID=989 RepID=A0A2T0XSS4_9BACT|nr:LytTR family transcriptional regulator DNA-binding domain-containing protein [Marinilabilia salmonicolor]PRZ01999.1 LytTR family two component transcriptional regulator [Marinilabilia salmonicolor]RCW39435.1 LytTR family two component transcriptional regulator [Marinilabilia salmonicolor]
MSNKISILIVEDEFMIAEDIAMRLEDMGYEVAEKIDNVDEAIAWLDENKVDIMLVDVNLRGTKTGIDLGRIVNERFHIPFVFLTSLANHEVVEMARQVNPAAYLLKPFNDRQVKVSVDMALQNFYGDSGRQSGEPNEVNDEKEEYVLKMPGCLFLRKSTSYHKVNFSDILWLEAESNYTTIHTKTEKYTYSVVLKSFEEKLLPKDFMRVHRSFIVNLSNVTGFEGNTLFIDKTRIPVTRAAQEKVFKHFRVI